VPECGEPSQASERGVTGPDTFLNQLVGPGLICFQSAPGYRLAVTIQHVGADYVRVDDGHGKTLIIPLGVIAWWSPA
jgi:hypothetical protein